MTIPMGPPESNGEIVVADLADELGTYRATIFKIAKRVGIQLIKRREPSRGNQLVGVLAGADADAIRAAFLEGRRAVPEGTSEAAELAPNEGMFYLIQLEPRHDPGRFKVGFTTDLEGRLRHHRCSAPFAAYWKTWACRRTWERAAIDCITEGTEQLHTEVFRTTSLEDLAERGERFFSVMPAVRLMANFASDET